MRLAKLERRLRELLEEGLVRSLPGRKPEDLLVQRLTEAIEAGTRLGADGSRIAPNTFTLTVHSTAASVWEKPEVLEELLQVVRTAAADAKVRFDAPPTFSISADPGSERNDVQVLAVHTSEPLGETHTSQAATDGGAGGEDAAAIPENAFVIVDGVKQFSLTQPVINIGRRLDNDVVIEDPRVSRHHAQLRAIKGRYVLFDLDSSGGSFINGQRTSQTVLYPGDVISLAGVSLIFGQDVPLPQRHQGRDASQSRAGADRATAIIRNWPSGFIEKKP